MSRLPGNPLDGLLDNWRGRLPQDLMDLPKSVEQAGSLSDASRCARCMLEQLVPALEHLGTRAHHRDVTPRNILLECQDGQYSFGLVDFGLAVDAPKWKAELLSQDIGGDGRYWPTSAWFVLTCGARCLDEYPALLQEYESCLDLHALGVCALQCLMERWAPEAQGQHSASGSRQEVKLQSLRLAWARFWNGMDRLWKPMFDAFRGGQHMIEKVRRRYADAGIYNTVSAHLCGVLAALRALRAVAEIQDLQVVCDALLLLVRPGTAHDSPTWQDVRVVLSGRSKASPPMHVESRPSGGRHWLLTGKRTPADEVKSNSCVRLSCGTPASAGCEVAMTPMESVTATPRFRHRSLCAPVVIKPHPLVGVV